MNQEIIHYPNILFYKQFGYKYIQIARFDTLTKTYKNYDCSGVLEIINIWTCIEGTYSFTAINLSDPNDIINIENGKFKLDFNPYN